ncbi:MAG: hypothetical protein Q9227_007401 [Pyrenula ochraceoflavens]
MKTIRCGYERLQQRFPWLTGKILVERGTYSIALGNPQDQDFGCTITLANNRLPITMHSLGLFNFPSRMLKESDLCDTRRPQIFNVRATFIENGVILTFQGAHQFMDMTGQGQFIEMLSDACSNPLWLQRWEPYLSFPHTKVEIDQFQIPGFEIADQIIHPPPLPPTISDPEGHHPHSNTAPECTWAYFDFLPSRLSFIKKRAIMSSISGSTIRPISTDDALSALLFCRISRARTNRLPHTACATLARTVDARHYVGVEAQWPGFLHNMTYYEANIRWLAQVHIGQVAAPLSALLDPESPTCNIGSRTRALVSHLANNSLEARSNVSFTARLDLSKDVMISSWARLMCYRLDFNLGLGKPVSVRRPQSEPSEGCVYIMPRDTKGGICVGLCLRNEDLDNLKQDGFFMGLANYIG